MDETHVGTHVSCNSMDDPNSWLGCTASREVSTPVMATMTFERHLRLGCSGNSQTKAVVSLLAEGRILIGTTFNILCRQRATVSGPSQHIFKAWIVQPQPSIPIIHHQRRAHAVDPELGVSRLLEPCKLFGGVFPKRHNRPIS